VVTKEDYMLVEDDVATKRYTDEEYRKAARMCLWILNRWVKQAERLSPDLTEVATGRVTNSEADRILRDTQREMELQAGMFEHPVEHMNITGWDDPPEE
jgi:hypothetical protein